MPDPESESPRTSPPTHEQLVEEFAAAAAEALNRRQIPDQTPLPNSKEPLLPAPKPEVPAETPVGTPMSAYPEARQASVEGASEFFQGVVEKAFDEHNIPPEQRADVSVRLATPEEQAEMRSRFLRDITPEQEEHELQKIRDQLVDDEKYEFVSERIQNGLRTIRIRNKETGVAVDLSPRLEGSVNLYLAPDPDPGPDPDNPTRDLENEIAFRVWVEKTLLGAEASATIDQGFEASFITTISANALKVGGGGLGPGVHQELLNKVRGRIHYHNGGINAQYNLKELANDIIATPEPHIEVFKTPGFQQAITWIDFYGAEYFRDGTLGRGHLVAYLRGLGYPPHQAALSAKLAENTMRMYGEADWHDGIRLIDGTSVGLADFPPDPRVPDQDAAGNPVLPENRVTLWSIHRYFVDHWYEINIQSSANGRGSRQMRQVLWAPFSIIRHPKKITVESEFLKKFTFLFASSGVRFATMDIHQPVQNNSITSLLNPTNNYQTFQENVGDLSRWAGRLNVIAEAKPHLNEKGKKDSLLRRPITHQEAVNADNMEQAGPVAFKNLIESKLYTHLQEDSAEEANALLAEAVLNSVRAGPTPEIRGEVIDPATGLQALDPITGAPMWEVVHPASRGDNRIFAYTLTNWGSKTVKDALFWMTRPEGGEFLTEDQARAVANRIGRTAFVPGLLMMKLLGFLPEGVQEFGKGIWAGFKLVFNKIRIDIGQ